MTETMFETDELEGLEDNFHNLLDVESPSIAASERETDPFLPDKEILSAPDTKEHQPEPLTVQELVSQELAKSGRGEGYKIEEGGVGHLSEDGKELFDKDGVSITKLILERCSEEEIATHYESLQQLRDGEIVINAEIPAANDPDTMQGSYMMQNKDGSISYGLTERKIERSEEEGAAVREEGEAPTENRWTAFEPTEHQTIQFEGRTEVLAQLEAAQEVDISRPDIVDVGNGEENSEQTTIIDIEAFVSPTVDSAETTTSDAVETGGVLIEAAHELSETENVSTSEFLPVDSLESLPVFGILEVTAHAPEAVVPEVTSQQESQTPDIRETAIYQAIIAFLKNDNDAIHVSEKPEEAAITESAIESSDTLPIYEPVEEAREDIVTLPTEHNAESASPLETHSQTTESAVTIVSIEATTTQGTQTEAPAAVSRPEEKVDIVTVLRDTDNAIRIVPEVVQDGHDRKIDEMESVEFRSETPERQSTPNAHEIFLRTLGIREKTIVINQERPYSNIQRASNPMVKLPSRSSIQPSRRTASKFGISLIEV